MSYVDLMIRGPSLMWYRGSKEERASERDEQWEAQQEVLRRRRGNTWQSVSTCTPCNGVVMHIVATAVICIASRHDQRHPLQRHKLQTNVCAISFCHRRSKSAICRAWMPEEQRCENMLVIQPTRRKLMRRDEQRKKQR